MFEAVDIIRRRRINEIIIICRCQSAASPTQTTRAEEGDDVFLRCLLGHRDDVSGSTVEWSKDGRRNVVHLYLPGGGAGQQGEEFRNRTFLFHRGLRKGNVTLRMSSVRLSDSGTYSCSVLRLNSSCLTVLTVGKIGEMFTFKTVLVTNFSSETVKRGEPNTPPPPLETKPESDGPGKQNPELPERSGS